MANRITKVYTRTGDFGTTGLGNGSRLDKSSARITAIGEIDELNSLIGIIISQQIPDELKEHLVNVQHILFDIGGELSLPGESIVEDKCIRDLEHLIDAYNNELPALKEFILPGGISAAAYCHFARAVCRRAERRLVVLYQRELVNKHTLGYINRLSDYLFVIARVLNRINKTEEHYWEKNHSNR